MRQTISLVTMLIFLFLCTSLSSQDKQEEKDIKEYVNVVNVEMVLRIMKDGQAQGGFKKEDFRLLENGKECRINGFFETRRTMTLPDLPEEDQAPRYRPGRLFLLLFWFNPGGGPIHDKLDYFFNKVYQPGDRVILSTPTQSFDFTNPEEKESVIARFLKHWTELGKITQAEIRANYLTLNYGVNDIYDTIRALNSLREQDRRPALRTAFNLSEQQYNQYVTEWKLRSDRLPVGPLGEMADNLEHINGDKWVLVFYERENIPLLDVRIVQDEMLKLLDEKYIDLAQNWADRCHSIGMTVKTGSGFISQYQAMRDRFAQAGAVIHLLQISPAFNKDMVTRENDPRQGIEFSPVYSNWDAVFQTISQASGGQIVDFDQGIDILDKLTKLEDISYTLTYVPQLKAGKKRKIELQIINPSLKKWQKHLKYGRRIEMSQLPSVEIRNIHTYTDHVTFHLEQYYPVHTQNGPVGHFAVSVAGQLEGSSTPTILYQQDITTFGPVEIPLHFDKPGDWTIWIRVSDLMSGRQAMERDRLTLSAETIALPREARPQTGEADELVPLLLKAAAYSERLKKAALRYTCQEEITEQIRTRQTGVIVHGFDRKTWQHDYQIVLKDGNLSENRLLVKRNQKKFDPPKPARMETIYQSQYSFFLPVTMLAAEKQPSYRYTIVGREKIRKRSIVRILARPIQAAGGLPGGELWVDEQDGSVWKIDLDAKTVGGFKSRFTRTADQGIHLIMSDVHEYMVRYKGIQFPSSTTITENHTYKRMRGPNEAEPVQMEVLRVTFRYRDYRFFDVSSQAEVLGWEEE